jgi:hypothetical protein
MRPASLFQRFASVEEIAEMVVHFFCPLASATNGAAMRADGGLIRAIYERLNAAIRIAFWRKFHYISRAIIIFNG